MLFSFGVCCKMGRHFYTTITPWCCIPASYCHLSATLKTINIIVFNLQDSRAVFWNFYRNLKFSFVSPPYTMYIDTAVNCKSSILCESC